MNRILVDIVLGKAENIEELMQQESAMVAQWKDMDLVEHLFLKNSEIGAILIFKDIDIEKAKELISQLPLFSYFAKIEYISLDKKF